VTHIAASGASVIAAANPGCQLQIIRGLRADGSDVRVVHPVSLLAAAYRGEGGRVLQRETRA
jgi:glycolate oxidase iron-sulfur subunit